MSNKVWRIEIEFAVCDFTKQVKYIYCHPDYDKLNIYILKDDSCILCSKQAPNFTNLDSIYLWSPFFAINIATWTSVTRSTTDSSLDRKAGDGRRYSLVLLDGSSSRYYYLVPSTFTIKNCNTFADIALNVHQKSVNCSLSWWCFLKLFCGVGSVILFLSVRLEIT